MSTGTVNPNRVVAHDEVQALVTIETVEQIAIRAIGLLAREGREETDVTAAALMLDEILSATSTRTCTAVKSQELSDRIAQEASTRVAQTMARVRRITNPEATP